MGDGFRWVTISHPNQPELEVTLMVPGPPLSPEAAEFVRGQLESGQMGGLGLRVDDCRKTYEELSAKGVTFVQEPSDRPYGVEAVMRDNTGNWLVLVEPKLAATSCAGRLSAVPGRVTSRARRGGAAAGRPRR